MREAFKQIDGGIADLVAVPVWAQSDDDLVDLVDHCGQRITQLSAVQALAVRELAGRNYPRRQGASSPAVWLRGSQRMTVASARQTSRLGDQLDARPVVHAAVLAGKINVEHAAVIDDAVKALAMAIKSLEAGDSSVGAGAADQVGRLSISGGSREIPPDLIDRCEQLLVELAEKHDPVVLRTFGARILYLVAPEIAEEAERRAVERDERTADQQRSFTMTSDGAGGYRLTGRLGAEDAAVVKAAIEPLCQPRPPEDDRRDERSATQRRADAFTDIFRRVLAGGDLPSHGGLRPQVNVTIDYERLLGRVGIGTLDTGDAVSAATARRMACDASILPAVMGGRSAVLDMGLRRRLFSGAIRQAVTLRDGGCAFPGCDRPPQWCDCHHCTHWVDGGPTSVANGCLLCRFHHGVVHRDGWEVFIDPADGLPTFIPPAYVDPLRRPRRNQLHRLRQ